MKGGRAGRKCRVVGMLKNDLWGKKGRGAGSPCQIRVVKQDGIVWILIALLASGGEPLRIREVGDAKIADFDLSPVFCP